MTTGSLRPVHRKGYWKKRLAESWQWYLLLLPGLVFLIIFHYIPMGGIVIAFKNYRPARGIFGSKWVGFANFTRFFQYPDMLKLIWNTLSITLLKLAMFPIPIIFALMLNEIKHNGAKRVMQTISYMPHFISLVVVCGLVHSFCSSTGIFNSVIGFFDSNWASPNLLTVPEYYRTIHIGSGIWQTMGWDSIIYLATLSGIDPQLYEAAYIDGASKLKRIWHITLPGLVPIIVVKFIMRLGHIMSVSSEKILLLYNSMTYETADTISTYMYRYGLLGGNYSMGTAVGILNSVISILILVTVNNTFRRLTEESLW